MTQAYAIVQIGGDDIHLDATDYESSATTRRVKVAPDRCSGMVGEQDKQSLVNRE